MPTPPSDDGRRFANSVIIDYRKSTVTIDGHPFPYYLVVGGATADSGKGTGSPPTVTLTMFADNVHVLTADEPDQHYASPWPLS